MQIPPRIRVIIKVGAFLFALLFVLYYVIYGVRYQKGVGFIPQNALYQAIFWNAGETLTFDGNTYTAPTEVLELYNLGGGCYDVTYKDKIQKQCIQNNRIASDVFVTYTNTTPYQHKPLSSCDRISRSSFEPMRVDELTFGTPISDVFVAKKVTFIQTQDILYACTTDYKVCHKLTEGVSGDAICSVSGGLVYNQDGKLWLVGLE